MLPPFPRLTRFAAAVSTLAAMSGCNGLEPSLQVHVTLEPAVTATCVRVAVFTSSDVSGEPAGEALVTRPAGKDEVFVAVYRRQLPQQVFVTARPMFGNACADPLVFNGDGDLSSSTFPPSGFTEVKLAIRAPAAAVDADGDGFVALPGGADCNDANGLVHPGAPEQCSEAADYNCNGKIGCEDPACSAGGCLPTPTRLAFANPALNLTAGACSAMPVQVDTANAGGVVAAAAPITVDFSALDGNLTIFSDAACATAVASAVIAAGQSRAQVWLKGTMAGPARLSAAATGLTSAQQTETIQPGPLNQLVFTSPAQSSVPLGGCSAQVAVQLRDAFGNPTSAGTPFSLGLTSDASSSTFKFYPDAACLGGAITNTPVASGATGATFYFKSTATSPGTVTMTASGQGKTATQMVGLVVRFPTQLVFPNMPVTAAHNACSPPVTLQTQDAAGQPAPVSANFNIPLSASGGTLAFYRDAACAMANTSALITVGSSSTAFFFKGPQGTPTITANGSSLGSPMQTETITAPAATQLAFATSAQTMVVAGVCSGQVDIEARDGSGTATAVSVATQVDLATSPSSQVDLYLGTGCTGSPISSAIMGAGTSKVTISFKGTLAATTAIQASTPGNVLAAASQSEGVVAAAPARVLFSAASKNQMLATGACGTLTLDQQDQFGNAATGGAAQVIDLTSNPAAGMAFYGAAGCTGSPVTTVTLASGMQQVLAYFKASAGGSYTLTEEPQGAPTGDTAPETITASTATELRFTSAAQTGAASVAAGACSAAVTLTTYDSGGAVTAVGASTSVNIGSTGPAGVAFYTSSACSGSPVTSVTIPGGSSAVTYYFQGTTSGAGTLTASASGLTGPMPQSFTILAGPLAKLAFSTAPFTVNAGACSGSTSVSFLVQVQDTYGNPSPVTSNLTVTISSANGTATGAFLGFNQNCNGQSLATFTIGTGTSTSTSIYFRSNVSGTWTISVSAPSLIAATQDETVNPLAPSQLAYTSPAQTVAQNACSSLVTIQIQDQYGNASAPASVTNVTLSPSGFFTSSACTVPVSGNVLAVPAQVADGAFYFKAPGMAGSHTITISNTGLSSSVDQVETVQ